MKHLVVGIAAHVDAGKTTLSEAILYTAGAIRERGRVDRGNSALDCHELEKSRGITIFAGEATFEYQGMKITLVDTPGHVDFSAETERMLQIIDCAVLVISHADGVQAHTGTVWKLLEAYAIPTFVFVTKCDLQRCSRGEMTAHLEKELGNVVDFEKNDEKYTNAEKIATCDETLLEEYLTDGSFNKNTIKRAILSRKLFPCFFGSGLKCEGVSELLEAVAEFSHDREYPSPFGARVYKVAHDKNDRLTKLRVTGGKLKVRDVIEYDGVSEKINQIRIYTGAKYTTADEVEAGEVCAVTGLSKTRAGQGLGSEEEGREGSLEPVISYRIVLPEDVDARVMLPKFKLLEEEDPKLRIRYNELLGEFSCELMGEVQAEILKSIVYERYGVNIGIDNARVIYKETVENTVEGVGHYEPLRHYAEVHLIIEKAPRGSGIEISSKGCDPALDKNYQNLIMCHLAERSHPGVLTGSPLTDVKITVAGGKSHIKHTEGGDFRKATYRALRQGLMEARSVLLEPYFSFRLEVPAREIGRAITDIKLMGGVCEPPESDGETTLLCGKAPVSTMSGYMTQVASYTGGAGRLSFEMCGYDVCHDADSVIKAISYDPEADPENSPDSVFCAHGAGFNVKWNKVKEHMHVPSYLERKSGGEERHRLLTIDEKELEAIMMREFGPIKRPMYKEPVKVDYEYKEKNIARVKTSCLIVDGYNVIFAWEHLRERAEHDLESARENLCHILSNYAHFTGCRVIVVFDAYLVPGGAGEKNDFHGIDVVYTKENETGDAYIERIVSSIGKNERVRVVTSDGLIQLSAVKSGVLRMSCAEFENEIERVDKEILRIIERESDG